MNLAELQKEAHAIAKSKGWWDTAESPSQTPSFGASTPSFGADAHRSPQSRRTFGDLIALVHSELSEALEAYRLNPNSVGPMREESPQYGLDDPLHGKYKPVGVPSELADVVIRVADMVEHYEENLEVYVRATPTLAYEGNTSTFGEWIAVIHKQLSDAWGAWYVQEDRCLWVNALARAVALTYRMATHYGIDLDAAIEAKMEYNRGRSYRHGGKAL